MIIVKNLQHGTKLQDLENLFTPFGHLVKVILPPSGVTALVVFEKLSSAAKAFEKIAYTKVKCVKTLSPYFVLSKLIFVVVL